MLALGFVALTIGAGAGLARLGWGVPAIAASSAALHGPLMIGAFFGVVIALERAVAIGRAWAYAGELVDPATIRYAIGRNVRAFIGQLHLGARDDRP